jgi:hypothetical protein
LGLRSSVAAIGVAAIIATGSMPAFAAGTPSFSNESATVGDQHDVTVVFTESGLASSQTVTEGLRGRALDFYACYDRVGKRAGSRALVEWPSIQSGFQANATGTIGSAAITLSVLPQDVCPRGETSYLYKTVFGGLVLTDLTNGVSARVRGRSTSCSPADCVPPAHL